MGTLFAVMGGLFLVIMFWEFPVFTVVVAIIIIAIASCSDVSVESTVKAVDEVVNELIDSTIQEPETPEVPIVENSVTEKCIDGKIYLLVIENGEKFPPGTKEDIFGYPVKCYE